MKKRWRKLSFIPSAVSEPRWTLHMCDNKCRQEGFKFYLLVAIVTQEGGKARTINLCKQCYSERRLKQGELPVTASKWKEMVEQKLFGGRVWRAFGMEQFARKMWERLTLKKAWVRSVVAEADKERQNGTDGDGQHEPPYKEELELVRRSSEFCFEGILMRRACEAGKPGDWKNYLEVFFKDDRLSM